VVRQSVGDSVDIEQVDFLVEEASMEEALRVLLPRMMGKRPFEIYRYTCKPELMQRLPNRLRGYARLPGLRTVVVLVDRDDDDCRKLKSKLDEIVVTIGASGRMVVVNRIVIEELEAWYFGDWNAVRLAYPKVSTTISAKKSFRQPDDVKGGTWEQFERVLQKAGYFKTGLRKIEAARAISTNMNPATNTSPSFQALRMSLQALSR
jgi:Domain of unknown function (DUF4276)